MPKKHKSDHQVRHKNANSFLEKEVTSESHSSSVGLLKTLEERRLEEYLERKRIKNDMKSQETPEEKRARRLRDKQAKESRRRQKMGWDNEYQHYTNQDNPFGDSNLTASFVWNKKLEKEGLTKVPLEAVEVLSRRKQIENKLELDKVKKRRLERELERQNREEEIVVQQRQREAAQFQEWERQEDQFHLEQARLRSVIRIEDGRAKPIDLLAQYISNVVIEEVIEMQMHEPYFLLNGLCIKDLEDLIEDIKVYVQLEKGKNTDFWNDMTIIVDDELQKLKSLQLTGESNVTVGSRREGIHQSVVKEVSEIFRGKSTHQLLELQNRIESKINERTEGIDISYWESLRSQLKAHMARSRLRDRHQEILRQKLDMLKTDSENHSSHVATDVEKKSDDCEVSSNIQVSDTLNADSNLEFSFQLYDEGKYSPKYLLDSDIENCVILSEEQDDQNINNSRTKHNNTEYTSSSEFEKKFNREARKGMVSDEAEFSVEAPVDMPMQMSSDKYRPRKPRYFNRVHTGFEWNKYNQTHYDIDNPPPKIVQGYKFNIFYPDLIEKSATPQYFLAACEDNSDFAILRFHAGPPYEDIAFKIVNREWEFSYKRGFRCQFHNNIFQLWFHFKRYRYRR